MNHLSQLAAVSAVAGILLTGCNRQATPDAPAQPLQSSQTAPSPAALPPSPADSPRLTPAPIRVGTAPGTHRIVETENGTPAEGRIAARVASPVEPAPRYVTHKRSKKKSALIVGSGAGAGAAIGAVAGGGKGAGIGALVGGLGGLVYDRATHKKTERVDR